MKKRSVYRWVAAVLALSAAVALPSLQPAFAQNPPATVVVSPASQNVAPGQAFTVSIIVDPKGTAIAGVQFNLTFDPGKVTVNTYGVAEGNLLKQTGANTYFSPGTTNNTAGTITGVSGAITQAGGSVSTVGTFATVSFTAGTATGISALTLSNVIVGDTVPNAVPIQVTGGSVTVGTPPQAGDANGDGFINALDITSTERIIAGLDPQTPGADANGDGAYNALDITMVERIIVGLA